MSWVVDSYHMNVGAGDGAVHVLAKVTGTKREAKKIVWIDGGTAGFVTSIETSFKNIASNYTNTESKSDSLPLDTIVITHFDSDHCKSVLKCVRRSSWLEKHCKYKDDVPLTRFIFPSTPKGKDDDVIDDDELKVESGVTYFIVDSEKKLEVHYGKDLLGTDFFADSLKPKDGAKQATSLAKLIKANPPSDGGPAMYCIAAETRSFGKPGVFQDMDVIWKHVVNNINQSSIGTIIAWPSGRISHYSMGDLDYVAEARLVDWLLQEPYNGQLKVNTIKLTHHGAASSTPPRLFTAFKPKNIIASAKDSYDHPDWEMVIHIRHHKLNENLAALLYITNNPKWMTRPKVTESRPMICSDYFGVKSNTITVGSEYEKLIKHAVKIFETTNNSVWKQMCDWAVAKAKNDDDTLKEGTITKQECFDQLREILREDLKGIWENRPPLTNDLQYICVISTDDDEGKKPLIKYNGLPQLLPPGPAVVQLTLNLLPPTTNQAGLPAQKPSSDMNTENDLNKDSEESEQIRKKQKTEPKQGLLSMEPEADSQEMQPDILNETQTVAVLSGPVSDDQDDLISFAASPSPSDAANDSEYWLLSNSVAPDSKMTLYRRLSIADSFNSFLSLLRSARIHLLKTPTTNGANFHGDDATLMWMKFAVNASSMSLAGSSEVVTSMSVTLQQNLVFDTALAGMAFDKNALLSITPSTGLVPAYAGSVMVFGLDPRSTSPSWTLQQIFDFFESMAKSDKTPRTTLNPITSFLKTTQWVLDTTNLGEKRNAMWFEPNSKSKTTIRLEFTPKPPTTDAPTDPTQECLTVLKKFWPEYVNITLTNPRIISRHQVGLLEEQATRMLYSTNTTIILAATIKASIATDTGPPVSVELDVAVELSDDGFTSLIVQSNKDNNFTDFGKALIRQFSKDITFSPESMIPQEITKNFYFRQLKLVLKDGNLSDIGVSVEVSATIGNNGVTEKTAILLEGHYQAGAGVKGLTLYGKLWFPIPERKELPARYYSNWEAYKQLVPLTPNAVAVMDIKTLFPQSMDMSNFPRNIPQFLVRAEFYLTSSSISISGTILSCDAYMPFEGDEKSNIPKLDFEEATIDATFNWSDRSIQAAVEFQISLKGPGQNTMRPTCTNSLIGRFEYDSGSQASGGSQWAMSASIGELQLGMLYDYLSPDSRDLLYDVLKEITIYNLKVAYVKDTESTFLATGEFVISDRVSIELTYTRKSSGNWSFEADVSDKKSITEKVLLGDIVDNLFGSTSSLAQDLPDFIANVEVLGPNAGGASLQFRVKKYGTDGVQLLLSMRIGHLEVVFVQLNTKARNLPGATATGPIRYFKLSFTGISMPEKVPVLSDFKAPFDEVAFFWLNGNITDEESADITKIQKDHGISTATPPQDPGANKKNGVAGGPHFAILSEKAIILDYPFGKARADTRKSDNTSGAGDDPVKDVTPPADDVLPGDKPPPAPVDSRSPKAPLKKSQGPLTINNVQLRYKENVLSVELDAIFALGPLTFALLGFEIGLNLKGGLDIKGFKLENVRVDLHGMAASFNKPPLTLEGGLIHKKDSISDMYVGGITIGFTPWLFQAAGFYGQTKLKAGGDEEFTSALVYAILRGPLITLEFATISGITGGFGYNVGIRIPKVEEIYKFPMIAPSESTDIITTLNGLMTDTNDTKRWFFPQDGAMWLAAGLTVSAFEMLDVTAVLVAQWSPQIQFHLLGLATADIPNAKSPIKLAHVELGFIASIDVPNGLFSVEAQLSPNSWILHSSCHLTGGFALLYWFKDSNTNRAGDFVFTIGGYHRAYQVPAGYPNPPRLGISWSLSDALSIRGEAYFAITPKTCMAGLHISATLHLGPLRAWFDAYADFLVNYAPFQFQAVGHVAIGVSFNLDIWFIHLHIGIEISATLYLYGPPVYGTIHVDFWIKNFDIKFGDWSQAGGNNALPIYDFYKLALEADSKVSQRSPGSGAKKIHVYSCFGGLISNDSVEAKDTDPWDVRCGPFSFGVNSYIAIDTATVNGKDVPLPADKRKDIVYAKPMHLKTPLTTTISITVKHDDDDATDPLNQRWRLQPIMKAVPRALWGQYDPEHDPNAGSGGRNNIGSLLTADEGCSRLMMGVELRAPESSLSTDTILPFNIHDALIEDVTPDDEPHWPPIPISVDQNTAWQPEKPLPPPKRTTLASSSATSTIPATSSPAAASTSTPSSTGTGTASDKPAVEAKPPPTNQWEAVQQAWDVANAETTVKSWMKAMGWKKKVSLQKPTSLIARVDSLFQQAPHLCVLT